MSEPALLSHEETLELLKAAQNGSKEAAEALIKKNSALIRCIVKKFLNRGVEYDDLYQIGSIGLLKAIQKYDFRYGVRFSTYAVPMVSGEIKRFLRDDGSIKISRSIKENASTMAAVTEKLRHELGREPRIDDISNALGISREEVVLAMESTVPPVSLQKTVYDEDSGVTVADSIPDDDGDKTFERVWLKEALHSLEPRERKIIVMHYFMDKTQNEIASVLGISQVQVSRLENKVLARIRNSAQE